MIIMYKIFKKILLLEIKFFFLKNDFGTFPRKFKGKFLEISFYYVLCHLVMDSSIHVKMRSILTLAVTSVTTSCKLQKSFGLGRFLICPFKYCQKSSTGLNSGEYLGSRSSGHLTIGEGHERDPKSHPPHGFERNS